MDEVDGSERRLRVGGRVDLHRHALPTTLAEILDHLGRPRRVMFGHRVLIGQFVIAISWLPAQQKRRCPAGSEMVGVMVLGTVSRPGMPGLDFRVGDLQFRLTPRPQCLQNDRVCFLGDQPLGSTAIRPIEKGKPREVADSVRKTMHLKQSLRPVEVILTHRAQGEVRLVDRRPRNLDKAACKGI